MASRISFAAEEFDLLPRRHMGGAQGPRNRAWAPGAIGAYARWVRLNWRKGGQGSFMLAIANDLQSYQAIQAIQALGI